MPQETKAGTALMTIRPGKEGELVSVSVRRTSSIGPDCHINKSRNGPHNDSGKENGGNACDQREAQYQIGNRDKSTEFE